MNSNISQNILRNVGFFCCGLYACFCDNLSMPKVASLACLLPIIYCIYITYLSKQGKLQGFEGLSFVKWYGLFLLFVCISALWSPNSIDSSSRSTETTVFVYKRALNAFFLTMIYYQLKPSLSELYITLKGVLIGAAIGCFVGLMVESYLIGFGRIGNQSYGAGTAFGNVADFGFALSILFMCKESRLWLYVPLLIFFLFVIVVSGSRQPLVCAVIYIFIISLLRKKNSISSYISFIFLALAVGLILFYLVMNVDFFYDAVGYRFQSLLDKDDASDIERTIMRNYAMKLFSDNPIAGVGVHGFATFFGQWYGLFCYSHNGITEILSCYGIIGFILYFRYYLFGPANILLEIKNNRLLGVFLCAVLINVSLTDLFHPIFLDVRSVFFMGLILKPYVSQNVKV